MTEPKPVSGLADLLHTMENTGTSAVMEVLREMQVVSFDHQRMSWKFREIEVSDDALDRMIRRKLRRTP